MRALLFLIIGAIVVAIGESLQCYDCAESTEGNLPGLETCKLPFSSNDTNKKCYVPRGYCMKGTGSMDGQTVVMRKCLPLEGIPGINTSDMPELPKDPLEMTIGPVKVMAHFCDKDLCNAASLPSVTTSFAILLLTTVLLM